MEAASYSVSMATQQVCKYFFYCQIFKGEGHFGVGLCNLKLD